MKESAHDVIMENPNMGKTTATHGLHKITMRGIQRSLAPFLRQQVVTMEATTSFSHSHALCTQLRSIHIIQHNSTTQLLNKLALSHIYTHMTFGLFTHIAPGGYIEHIHISVPYNRSGRLPPGLQSSGSSHIPSGGTCSPTCCVSVQT